MELRFILRPSNRRPEGPEPAEGPLTAEELQLPTRNRGLPVEGSILTISRTGSAS